MSHKSKGIAAERELVHLLQEAGFAAIRVAGSGNTKAPSTDILAGNGKRCLSIECKSVRGKYRYIPKKEIEEFVQFSHTFGAEAWIAVRFMRKPWMFLRPEDLVVTEQNLGITERIALEKGVIFANFLR